MLAPVWWRLLLACSIPADEGGDSAVATEEAQELPEVHPTLTADEVGTQLHEALRLGLPTAIGPATEWARLMAMGDEGCPGGDWALGTLQVYNPEGCFSSTGVWYEGAGGGGIETNGLNEDGELLLLTYHFKGDAAIIDQSGNTLEYGGYSELNVSNSETGSYAFEGNTYGSYHYFPSQLPWLSLGSGTALEFSGTIGGGEPFSLTLDGGSNTDGVSVFFSNLQIGQTCASTATGKLGIRGADGYWYDLTFDEETCDGCGEVTFDGGEALGQTCVDVMLGIGPSFDAILDATAALDL